MFKPELMIWKDSSVRASWKTCHYDGWQVGEVDSRDGIYIAESLFESAFREEPARFGSLRHAMEAVEASVKQALAESDDVVALLKSARAGRLRSERARCNGEAMRLMLRARECASRLFLLDSSESCARSDLADIPELVSTAREVRDDLDGIYEGWSRSKEGKGMLAMLTALKEHVFNLSDALDGMEGLAVPARTEYHVVFDDGVRVAVKARTMRQAVRDAAFKRSEDEIDGPLATASAVEQPGPEGLPHTTKIVSECPECEGPLFEAMGGGVALCGFCVRKERDGLRKGRKT